MEGIRILSTTYVHRLTANVRRSFLDSVPSRKEGFTTKTTPPPPFLYTIPEAAEALRISRTKLYELLAKNEIQSVRIGRSRKIPASTLRSYVHRLQAEQEEGDRNDPPR
ncbi:helix-turn-helix domain-containing protein [Streptosporangium sp. V21-05]|uniref:helix-turn-helix domain-containing protein n=1 Tax=Streptosporangium sp. V21-05 TaxID=3446115 RepID=UPI003F538D0E